LTIPLAAQVHHRVSLLALWRAVPWDLRHLRRLLRL